MANDKLYITISDERSGGGGVPTPDNAPKTQNKNNNVDPLGDYAKHEFLHLIKSEANRMVTFGISQIGNLTGNYASQTATAESLSILRKVGSIATSAYAGFKMTGGNIYGALIGAGVQIVSDINSELMDMHNRVIANNRRNYEVELLRIRAGLDNTTNGSRTGE